MAMKVRLELLAGALGVASFRDRDHRSRVRYEIEDDGITILRTSYENSPDANAIVRATGTRAWNDPSGVVKFTTWQAACWYVIEVLAERENGQKRNEVTS